LIGALRYALLSGGKRIRAFLVFESAKLFSCPYHATGVVATSVEMVHCYSLIHDDLPAMDDDDLRRGIPTLHKAYDEPTAILVGDALQSLAFEILSQNVQHLDDKVQLKLICTLARSIGTNAMVGGQFIDIEAEKNKQSLKIDELKRLQSMKTGALISFCCQSALIMGQASNAQSKALQAYASDIGLAYQMSDDLLDATSLTAILGKKAGKDESRGKATFVRLLGVEQAIRTLDHLVDQAIDHLKIFDERANHLRSFALFIKTRKK
ncbi:MAG: polyprenyl synthetase family protein, partial [Pseudomonadota bacterium]